MKKYNRKCLDLLKKKFIGLLIFSVSLARMVNVYSLTTCISLNNQACMARTVNLGVMEVLKLLMIHLIKYVVQTKQKTKM